MAVEGSEQDKLSGAGKAPSTPRSLSSQCVCIDLEVGRQDGRIFHLAAVRGDTERAFVHRVGSDGPLDDALTQLDAFAEGAGFVLGHNVIAFDLPHLAAMRPDLRLLALPPLDTLRLNPLAFPKNPYHRLVKHYQDGQLNRVRRSDPELDARLALALFGQQQRALAALCEIQPDLLAAWHGLVGGEQIGQRAFDALFVDVRGAPRPDAAATRAHLNTFLARAGGCSRAIEQLGADPADAWPLAYALAWLSVAGGNSVAAPWVTHQFPRAGEIVRALRDRACTDPACPWCRERHDATRELTRWFRLDAFRPEPRGADGRPLQQAIVEAAMAGDHVLGILPTGTGKSLCYQLPALSRYEKTGALTVVISPLVALMADQVAGMEARGIGSAAAVNGLLSMPERADVLERLRLGNIAILLVSPEQLRSRALRRALAQREIGAWVMDEAHCLSKWGHDFRPDYRYVGRFIRERAGAGSNITPLPPLLCLTATAKPDVVDDITAYFAQYLGVPLAVFDGGANRSNLDFAVVPTDAAAKFDHVHQLLAHDLSADAGGGAIVYCSSQARTEQLAAFLREKGWSAEHFHAGVPGTTKKDRQQRFIAGALRVIVATNAFGMGIDKPDVRLVVHADVPGSLENYLQEAGRAGRDQAAARCVLLYANDDVERQFSLSARSRLTQREIVAILKSLRGIDRRKRLGGEVVVTAGEILLEERDGEFQRDRQTDDTRVRTAVAWLEEARLLTREENVVQMFPSSLRVSSVVQAREKLRAAGLSPARWPTFEAIVATLLHADPDEGVSTDELMLVTRLEREALMTVLLDLERFGLASNDLVLTAFVHRGVERSSLRRFEEASKLEAALVALLREEAPDASLGEALPLYLRSVTQRLKDEGLREALPERVWRILRSLANDGRTDDGGRTSLDLRRIDAETLRVTLQRAWSAIATTAQMRRDAAGLLLAHLLARLPEGVHGTDLLVSTTMGELLHALHADLALAATMREPQKLLDHALMWLHEQEAIRLNKGLAVFRPAMTIRLGEEPRNFAKTDFEPLAMHYRELVLQIHVMAEYAQRGLEAMADALQLTMDYFTLQRDAFTERWLPQRDKELARETTPQSWRAIVEALRNPVQQRIVADDRERSNVLLLAGPGSGKTRVLVHRIAWLVRVRREDARGIVALAYNRHAAVQIRRRLHELIGDDANGVLVLTCHALAMRLTGASFERRDGAAGKIDFDALLAEAADLLEGRGLLPEEADEQRARLLAGFRWMLVDEYQDIGPGEYRLIAALAGRTLADADAKLGLFAVGDDDQNLYAFKGASVEFIRRFEADYAAKPTFMVENHRSTAHIVAAANRLIAAAPERLKSAHPIEVDRARRNHPGGGAWAKRDPVARGRVQWLPEADDPIAQAVRAIDELRRLAALDAGWDWSRCAVIASQWKRLEPVRAVAELHGIAVQMADEDPPPLMRLRETRALLAWLDQRGAALVDAPTIATWIAAQPGNPWWALLAEAVDDYAAETAGSELPRAQFIEALVDFGRDQRRRQRGLLLLTAHRAKGLEFDHVVVLDGHWDRAGSDGADAQAPRRAFYVAMTRARQTLALGRLRGRSRWLADLPASDAVLLRPSAPPPALAPELMQQHLRLTLTDVDLSCAGRRPTGDAIHAHIAALAVGDPLQLRLRDDKWEVLDRSGVVVGRLARSFGVPADRIVLRASVCAVVVWRRADQTPEWIDTVRCETWEVVLADLVLAPVGQGAI